MRFSATRRSLAALFLAALAAPGFSQAIPPSTAIPVALTKTIAANHAQPGDPVAARTLEDILLPGHQVVPAGTLLTGHVVASSPFVFDSTPYAVQRPSLLSIRFDRLAVPNTLAPLSPFRVSAMPGGVVVLTLSLRAIAGPVASHEAEIPHGLDEMDWSSTRTLIGGDTASPLEKTILAPDGSTVGYRRSQGNAARLLASAGASDPGLACDATTTEQSIGDFSADACGVYGLHSVVLANNGARDGAFTLESTQRSVQLDAGTTALLEVSAR